MTKITYDNEVKAMLRASGMTDEEIRQSEIRAGRDFKKLMDLPAATGEPNSIERKFTNDDLTPMGTNRPTR